MSTKTVNAASNPSLANSLVNQAMSAQETTPESALVISPSDNLVTLPGGFITEAGEVIKTAEVRELTGRDEELIARSNNAGRTFSTILSCGVAKIGNEKATEKLLDELLSGDRDALMVGIYKATFGNTTTLASFCIGCGETKTIEIDVDEDLKSRTLADPIADRSFLVKGKSHEYRVILPNGAVQRELSINLDKSLPELTSILLQATVMEIDGKPVISKNQIQSLGLMDRKAISEAIAERNPGPEFSDVTVTCPDCDGEVVVSINLGTLFRI